MFLLLTDKYNKKAIVNMNEVVEISFNGMVMMTEVHYERKIGEQYTATLKVKETPEEIWEMIGAMK
jgi:hypothetical protein